MTSKVYMGMIDRSGEATSTAFYLPQVTAANYDTVTGNGVGENVGDLRLAVAAITLCNFTRHTVTCEVYPEVGALPSSANAQREIKLLVTYVDDVNSKKGRITIPGVDLTLVAQAGTDVVDIVSNVNAAALLAAIEANAVSQDGNAITVTGMRIVGRNN